MKSTAIGVIDVGKTNLKLYLLSAGTGAQILASRQIENRVVDAAPYPHFDSGRHWQWLLAQLKKASADFTIEKLIATAHGASAALLAGDELALPILDYEHDGPECCEDYPTPPFADTFSPPLPLGMNVGRQLYWQQRMFPEAFSRVSAILPYPQYWAWRLSGVAANEFTSIGAHTDLWLPREKAFSAFARQQGWSGLYPPLRRAWETLGPVKPDIAASTGLPADCQVLTGLHDSNASLLPHLIHQSSPFTVVSTGTWVIVMSVGAGLDRLDPAKDTLANVNVFGDPVGCARFMGGREFALLSEGAQAGEDEIFSAAEKIIRERVFALPNWTQSGGPMPGRQGEIVGDFFSSPQAKLALASLYCALMVNCSLDAAGAGRGVIIIEGAFIKNALFCEALSLLRAQQRVLISDDFAGTVQGAAILANWSRREQMPRPVLREVASKLGIDIGDYAREWLEKSL